MSELVPGGQTDGQCLGVGVLTSVLLADGAVRGQSIGGRRE